MTCVKKVSPMAGIIALMGVVYMPQAGAMIVTSTTPLGVLSPASAVFISNVNLSGGTAFKDIFSFDVNSDYVFSGSLGYTITNDAYSLNSSSFPAPTASNGLDLASVQIVNAGSGSILATGTFNSVSGSSAIYTINIPPSYTFYDYRTTILNTVSLNNVFLASGNSYRLEITGSALGLSTVNNDGYSGSFSVSPSTVTSVPVPGAIWMFGGGLGLLSILRRRNQRGWTEIVETETD